MFVEGWLILSAVAMVKPTAMPVLPPLWASILPKLVLVKKTLPAAQAIQTAPMTLTVIDPMDNAPKKDNAVSGRSAALPLCAGFVVVTVKPIGMPVLHSPLDPRLLRRVPAMMRTPVEPVMYVIPIDPAVMPFSATCPMGNVQQKEFVSCGRKSAT
jgi:hypothetical protein